MRFLLPINFVHIFFWRVLKDHFGLDHFFYLCSILHIKLKTIDFEMNCDFKYIQYPFLQYLSGLFEMQKRQLLLHSKSDLNS